MKGCAFNHSDYRVGLSVLTAFCLITGFTKILAAINLDGAERLDHAKRRIVYTDIPAGLREWLESRASMRITSAIILRRLTARPRNVNCAENTITSSFS